MNKILQNEKVKKLLIAFGVIIIAGGIIDKILLPWYVSASEVTVPSVVGLTQEEAIKKLEDEDLEVVIKDTTFDKKYPEGIITKQNPKEGEVVKEGRRVYLFVSGGEQMVVMPLLKGRTLQQAKVLLEKFGLRLGYVEEIASDKTIGIIFDQQYIEGTKLKKGSTVNIAISIGAETEEGITVPDLIGKSLTEAQQILADSSLGVGKLNYQPSHSLLPNTILDQYPSKGNKLKPGEKVDLFITKPADETTEATEGI